MLEFDPTRPWVAPLDAATVLVVGRGAAEGAPLEVLTVTRHVRSAFLGGAVVFPGGKVDPSDGDAGWAEVCTPVPSAALRVADGPAHARALAVAACRELFEEAAILPIEGDSLAHDEALALRRSAVDGAALRRALARAGLRLDLSRLVPFARWITPEAERRRFDARFFLLPLPAGQRGAADEREATALEWASPSGLLERGARREIWLAPPTLRCLELLATARDVEAALALARTQSLLPICPRFVPDEHGGYLALPGDPSHDVRQRRVAGGTRFVLRDGRFEGAASGDALNPTMEQGA